MKLSTNELKQIIKEELSNFLNEGDDAMGGKVGNPHYSEGKWGDAFEELHMATEPGDQYDGNLDISGTTLDNFLDEMVSAKYHEPQTMADALENLIYYRDEVMKTDLGSYKRSVVGPLLDQAIIDLQQRIGGDDPVDEGEKQ